MSDHTDDDSPRERYEGPMASAANGNSLKNSKSSVETRGCEACGGTGFFDARHSDRFCPTCEGTGTAPNGNSPDNPESSVETVGVAPYPDRYIPADPLSGLNPNNATGHDGCIRGLEQRNAVIAEQAAEIERLRLKVDAMSNERLEWEGEYAAIEAERDELQSRLEDKEEFADDMREVADTRKDAAEQLLRERDELRLKVEALEAERDEALKARADTAVRWQEDRKEKVTLAGELRVASEDEAKALKERDEARARAEAYLAVIYAKDAEIKAIDRWWRASLRSVVAMQEAGLAIKTEETS